MEMHAVAGKAVQVQKVGLGALLFDVLVGDAVDLKVVTPGFTASPATCNASAK